MQTIFKGLLLIMAISRFINSYYFDFVAYKVEHEIEMLQVSSPGVLGALFAVPVTPKRLVKELKQSFFSPQDPFK